MKFTTTTFKEKTMTPTELTSRLRILESGLRGQHLADIQPRLEAPLALAQRLQALKEDLAKSTHLTKEGQQATWTFAIRKERQAIANWFVVLDQERAALQRTKDERLRPPPKTTNPIEFAEQEAIRHRLREMTPSDKHLAYLRALAHNQHAILAAVAHDPCAPLDGAIIAPETQAAADRLRLADLDGEEERLLRLSYVERDLLKMFDAADPPTPTPNT